MKEIILYSFIGSGIVAGIIVYSVICGKQASSIEEARARRAEAKRDAAKAYLDFCKETKRGYYRSEIESLLEKM